MSLDPKEGDAGKNRPGAKPSKSAVSQEKEAQASPIRPASLSEAQLSSRSAMLDQIPLNLNIQIHISADAGTDQIETIFRAMRMYLNDAPST